MRLFTASEAAHVRRQAASPDQQTGIATGCTCIPTVPADQRTCPPKRSRTHRALQAIGAGRSRSVALSPSLNPIVNPTMTIFEYLLFASYIAVGAAFFVVGRISGYRRFVKEQRELQWLPSRRPRS